MAKSKQANGEAKESKCPVTKEQFVKAAKPLTVTIGGSQLVATVKEFSSGSFGYYANGKIVVEVDGVPVSFQVGLNVTAVGSKPSA